MYTPGVVTGKFTTGNRDSALLTVGEYIASSMVEPNPETSDLTAVYRAEPALLGTAVCRDHHC